MLTAREQELILAEVRRVVQVEKRVVSRLKRSATSTQSAATSKERAWDKLRDLLKEVG